MKRLAPAVTTLAVVAAVVAATFAAAGCATNPPRVSLAATVGSFLACSRGARVEKASRTRLAIAGPLPAGAAPLVAMVSSDPSSRRRTTWAPVPGHTTSASLGSAATSSS